MVKLSRDVLCLDWDHRWLRLVVARTSAGRVVLEDAHAHHLPGNVDPENPESLGQFIQQTLRRHHWRFKRAVVDIPRDRAVINRLTLPPTPDHELASAVRFQAMKELPFPLEEAVVDYVVKRRNEQGLAIEVLLAAVTQEALGVVQATCEAAGLAPARIGLRPYANLVSVAHLFGLAEKRVLFVDVGPTMTEIDVMDTGTLAFARAANVTTPMPPDAAKEDSRVGSFSEPGDLEAADAATEAAVNELVVEITRTLQAYRASVPDAVIDQIVIGGGTGVEVHLLAAVERRFNLPTVLFDPTEALQVSADEALKLRSFSAGLGLAWGLSEEGAFELDFLNPKKPVPPRQALKRRLRMGAMVAGVLLAGAIATDATLYLRRRGDFDRYQKQVTALKKELKHYLEIENSVEEVEDWAFQSVWLEDLLRLSESAVEPGKEMLVQQVKFDHRTASASLKKVQAMYLDVPAKFVSRLNELEVGEGRPYQAEQLGWRPLQRRDTKFQGAVDVKVELRGLKKHLDEQEDRTRARKRRLRGL